MREKTVDIQVPEIFRRGTVIADLQRKCQKYSKYRGVR